MTDDIDDAEIVHEEPRAIVHVDRSATALAAQARAMVQSRVYLARENPRQLARVRDSILALTKRPSLAQKAVYAIERGGEMKDGVWVPSIVRGPSIKLANSLRIAMGNMDTSDMVMADDGDYRTIMVTAIDYETNSSESRSIVVRKTVERKGKWDKSAKAETPPDREIISSRKNSYGKTVYLCRATEAEIQEAANSAASRARRNAIIALVPADIVEDAVNNALAVATSVAAQQRVAEITRLRAAYAKLGVSQADLATYLGRELDQATADDLVGLGMLATSIAERHTTWKEAARARAEARAAEEAGEPDAPPPERPSKGADATRAAVERATKEK